MQQCVLGLLPELLESFSTHKDIYLLLHALNLAKLGAGSGQSQGLRTHFRHCRANHLSLLPPWVHISRKLKSGGELILKVRHFLRECGISCGDLTSRPNIHPKVRTTLVPLCSSLVSSIYLLHLPSLQK